MVQFPAELAIDDLLELEDFDEALLDVFEELLEDFDELPPPQAPRSVQVCFDALFSSPGSNSGQAAGIAHQEGILHEYSRPLWDTF